MRAIALLLCVLGPASGQALKLRTTPDAGKSVLVRQEARQEVDTRVTDAAGKELRRQVDTGGEVAEYTLAVIEVKGGQPVKFTHEYARAERAQSKEKAALPWQGRKVLFELAEGKLRATAEGKFLDRKAELEKEASSRLLDTLLPLLPKKEVKPGDQWDVPDESAKKAASGGRTLPFEELGGTAKGKLLRTYEKDGVRFGVIQIDASFPLKVEGGKLEYKIHIDAAIDGASTRGTYRADLTVTGHETLEEKGRKLKLGGTTRVRVTLEVGEQK
jgi:hypothetical protein